MPSTLSLDGSALMTIHSADTAADYGKHLVELLPLTTVTVPPYTTTNAVFFGHQHFWVIDPGSPLDDQQLLLKKYIDSRHARGQKLMGICLTHHHGDHTKAAAFLAATFSVPIFAHEHSAQHVKFAIQAVSDDDIISHHDEPTLRVLYTPGHSDDHVVYYAEDLGILIAGDMITDRGTILIPPIGGSLRIYLDSLEKLTHLPLKAIIPAHGQPIVSEPNRFLIAAMKHRFERIKAVFAVIKKQDRGLDATDITQLVYRHTIAENLMVFAQLSVESSLHWLKEAGLICNPQHSWQPCSDYANKEQEALLDRLEKIDERLRNT